MLKKQIDADFITAFKGGNKEAKDTLGMIKTKIMEAEKKDGKELTDDQVISVIQGYNKQIDQTIQAIGPHPDGAAHPIIVKAEKEKELISKYLPVPLTEDQIKVQIRQYLEDEGRDKVKLGDIMQYFKKEFNGRYDARRLKEIYESIINA